MANRHQHHPVSAPHLCSPMPLIELELGLATLPFLLLSLLLSLETGLQIALDPEKLISSLPIQRSLRANHIRAKAAHLGRWMLFCRSYLDVRELLLNQEADLIPVIPWVIEAAAGWLPISSSSARLLVISSHWLSNIPMGNKSACDKTTGNIRLQVFQITAYIIVLFVDNNSKK